MTDRTPPMDRSHASLRLTAAAALGRFELQQCSRCAAVQYPPREACHRCLSINLSWKPQAGGGTLLAQTRLAHSHHPFFQERLPWNLGIVHLDCGPIAIAHLPTQPHPFRGRVNVKLRLDKAGQGVLVAVPESEEINMSSDRQLSELTCDVTDRVVLVTDGASESGLALVNALIEAGARKVWGGYSSGPPASAHEKSGRHSRAVPIPLDLTSTESVRQAAETIAPELDIIINDTPYTAAVIDAGAMESASGTDPMEVARAQMEVRYFGLLRLAHAFGPALRARSQVRGAALAWVNILAVDALSNFPSRGTFSASISAARSLSQWLRAGLQPSGVRVIDVFPADIQPPALAAAVVGALKDGVEEVYPGDSAQDWLQRWLQSPKVLERELAAFQPQR